MDECLYEPVGTAPCDTDNREKPWVLFLRQALVCSGPWVACFMLGMCMGLPTVAIPQIRREANSTEAVSIEMVSSISSAYHYISPVCVLFLPPLADFIGHKWTCFIISWGAFAGFGVMYYSTTTLQLFIGELIQGLLASFTVTEAFIILTEYTSPKYRGIFIAIKTASYMWGVWMSNALGTFFYWKIICLLGVTCSIYNLVTVVIFWPESPYWLALKNKFEKCEASHRWLKGIDENSKKELEGMIDFYRKSDNHNKSTSRTSRYVKLLFSRAFAKTIALSIVAVTLLGFCGKLVLHVYAIDIFKSITNNESTAYTSMLILDGLTVAAMYAGCGLAKILNRRTQYLTATTTGVVCLYALSIYLYFVKISIINENKYISLALLSIYSIAICLGPMVLTSTVYAELLPINGKTLSVIILGTYSQVYLGILLKCSPYLFKALTMSGTFLFFAISSTVCLIILYKYLTETKDKTILEIALIMQQSVDDSKVSGLKCNALEENHNKVLLVRN